MTDNFNAGFSIFEEQTRPAGHRADRGRSGRPKKFLPKLLIIGLVLAGLFFGITKIKDAFSDAPDYPGPGTGEVVLAVNQGDSVAEMGRNLLKLGVVKSVDAFLAAANADPKSTSIQVGNYVLKKEMKASDALDLLLDPQNIKQDNLVIPEGSRVKDIIETIAAETSITSRALELVLGDPTSIGLPAAAKGNPEGYLYPATYPITPDESATSLLKKMVDKYKEVAANLDLEAKAAALDLTPHQLITVASILEYEGNRAEDYPKIAQVLYNRLAKPMRLQLDSTVSFATGKSGDVWTTEEDRQIDSPYNTYANDGLPPGPIGSPGEVTIQAALNPAAGNWIFFVPDYANQTTVFTDSLSEHNAAVERLKQYCLTSEDC